MTHIQEAFNTSVYVPPIATFPAPIIGQDSRFPFLSAGSNCHGRLWYDAVLVVSSIVFVVYLAVHSKKNLKKLCNGGSSIMICYYALLWVVSLLNLVWCFFQVWQCSPGKEVAWNLLSLFTASGMLCLEVTLVAFLLQQNYTSSVESLTRTFVVSGIIFGVDILLKVHAIVLLYNYYHRKQCPEVEFRAFDSFCKLAGILRPALHGYLRYFQRSNKMELIDVEEQVSITEKAIMDACDISKTLDASKEVPYFEEWPSTKVTVFLVDSRIENCVLQFGSITQGIWSVIEKDVEILHQNLGTTETKRKDKKQRVISKNGSVDFLQLAYMAVKEATDISQNELVVLENHVMYSLSKEKTAARFYIMQCTQSGYEKVISFPLKDAIQRLQGPLIEKTSGQWTYNPVLEYFHVLPYAQILSDWLSREVVSNGLQNSTLRKKPGGVETSCERAMDDTSESSLADGVGEDLELLEKKETIGFPNAFYLPSTSQNEERCKNTSHTTQIDKHQNMIPSSCAGRDLNGLASGLNMKFKLMDSTKQSLNASFSAEKAANGNKISENLSSHQNETGGLSLAAHQPNSRSLEKLQSTLAAKGNLLSETALKVLIKKRDKLCLQMRNLGDEIAECERKMMTIADGGEDDLTVKIETIIEGCNDVFQGSSRGNTQLLGEQCSPQYNKRKIVPEAVLNIQNPCQELDGVCYANNWILPTYRVYPTEGGFKANVSIRGVDFDYTIEGELQSNPREARDSAAAGILVKLRAITAKA